MIDSAQIVNDWMETLNRQQNTLLYGRVDDDGIWRDKATGKTPAEMDAWEAEQRAAGIEKPEGAAAVNGEPIADEGLQGGSTPKGSLSRFSLGKKRSSKLAGSPSTSSLRAKDTVSKATKEDDIDANAMGALDAQSSPAVKA